MPFCDHCKKSTEQDESASDATALIAAAHRMDNLIHHRRTLLWRRRHQPRLQILVWPSCALDRDRGGIERGGDIANLLLRQWTASPRRRRASFRFSLARMISGARPPLCAVLTDCMCCNAWSKAALLAARYSLPPAVMA